MNTGTTGRIAGIALPAAIDRKQAMNEEMQQALLQYWEASTALRAADTAEKVDSARELWNTADKAIWILRQNPEMLRRRVEIVNKDKQNTAPVAAISGDNDGGAR